MPQETAKLGSDFTKLSKREFPYDVYGIPRIFA